MKQRPGQTKLHKTESNPKDKEEGDTEVGEEIKLPKEEEDAKDKDEGGKEMGEEIKLPKVGGIIGL